MPYNNVGHNSKASEETASESTDKLPFSTNPLSFDAAVQGTPTNIRVNFILCNDRNYTENAGILKQSA